MSLAVVGVPTIASFAAVKQNQTTLEMLLNLQKLVDEFKVKVTEMDEEIRTVLFYENVLSTVRGDTDRPLLRKGLTYSIRSPVPLCNPVLPYPIHVFLRSIPLIPA